MFRKWPKNDAHLFLDLEYMKAMASFSKTIVLSFVLDFSPLTNILFKKKRIVKTKEVLAFSFWKNERKDIGLMQKLSFFLFIFISKWGFWMIFPFLSQKDRSFQNYRFCFTIIVFSFVKRSFRFFFFTNYHIFLSLSKLSFRIFS